MENMIIHPVGGSRNNSVASILRKLGIVNWILGFILGLIIGLKVDIDSAWILAIITWIAAFIIWLFPFAFAEIICLLQVHNTSSYIIDDQHGTNNIKKRRNKRKNNGSEAEEYYDYGFIHENTFIENENVQAFCPSCGTLIDDPETIFCPSCGMAIK